MPQSCGASNSCVRAIRLLAILLALVAVAISTAAVGRAEASLIAGPLTVGSPQLIDTGEPFADPDSFFSLSCPTSGLCVGTTVDNEIVSSTDPSATSTGAWSLLPIAAMSSSAAEQTAGRPGPRSRPSTTRAIRSSTSSARRRALPVWPRTGTETSCGQPTAVAPGRRPSSHLTNRPTASHACQRVPASRSTTRTRSTRRPMRERTGPRRRPRSICNEPR